jgi:hypothetical protein
VRLGVRLLCVHRAPVGLGDSSVRGLEHVLELLDAVLELADAADWLADIIDTLAVELCAVVT